MPARAAIYLDANAGAPLSPQALEALLPLLGKPDHLTGNPSSTHAHGRKARALVRNARESVARSLGTSPERVFFTSSGTEACQWPIRAVLEAALGAGEKPHWILTAAEHEAIDKMAGWLCGRGGSVSRLPLDEDGRPRVAELPKLFRPETRLVSAIWVHNETGVVTDVEALSAACRERKIPLHLDAAQAWGKLPMRLDALGADFLSLAGHKIGALPGTGALWVRPGVAVDSFLRGSQESGKRGGTENLLGLVSLGAAAGALDPDQYESKTRRLQEILESEVLKRVPGARVFGAGARRVSNTSFLGFGDVPGAELVIALDLEGFSVSAGSACSSGAARGPSRVLEAIGLPEREAESRIRVSLSSATQEGEVRAFVEALERAIEQLRKAARGS